ncbi:radical SAM family heme chaperone HemW [Myxococcota bacterium]|nr:radical SAM family heme chaperone HemW [Myxococcota bacterium]
MSAASYKNSPQKESPKVMAPWGIYVHFPYCRRRCPYCDFNVHVQPIPHTRYAAAVVAEMGLRADEAGEGPASTLYFGGGTPALWRPEALARVIEAVDARFGLRAEAEITVECNPEDVTEALLISLRATSVNRLSLGLQSFSDETLRFLGRTHSAADNLRAVATARRAGFDNLSVDLIYGVAGQHIEAAIEEARAAARLAPHVSSYQLTIPEGTPFGRRAAGGASLILDDDLQATLFEGVRAALTAEGVIPYEISNAARPGFEAVHNGLYWADRGYLGLGAGAHGFDPRAASRWSNLTRPDAYLEAVEAGRRPEAFREHLDPVARREERLMLGLRRDAGVSVEPEDEIAYGAAARRLEREALLLRAPGLWRVTPRGRLLLDSVIAALLAP